MKIGLQIPFFNWPGSPDNIGTTLMDIARTADAAGFDSLWVMDHFFQYEQIRGTQAADPMLEAYTTLGFLAGATRRIELGALVTGVYYRDPGLLIKAVTSLDVLSGGRAWLGIGAGGYEREAVGLGLPFPPQKERFERLEETLQIAKKMWSGDVSPYDGKYYHLAEPINSPQPLRKPHPPILVGGGGEQKTLRLVAQYADACNLVAFGGNDVIAHKLAVLRQHCDDLGRDDDTIEKTLLARVVVGDDGIDVAATIAACRAWAALGIQHVIFLTLPGVHMLAPIEAFGREVIPAVVGL